MIDGSWLVMSQGPQPGQTFMLDQDWLTIGRDPSNDIVINDPQVSRQHARITRQGKVAVIEDLGSTNGTFVNGMRLTGPHVMSNGDVIGLGDAVTLTYYEVGVATDATETVVGQPAAVPSRPAPTPPPPGRPPTPPPAQPFESFPSVPAAAPPVKEKRNLTWLWVGCGVLVLLAVVACVAVFVLDYLQMLPPVFYEPLRWLGFF